MFQTGLRGVLLSVVLVALPGAALASRDNFPGTNAGQGRTSHAQLVETHGGVFITNSVQPSTSQTRAVSEAESPNKKFVFQGTVQDIRSKVVYLSHDGTVTAIDASTLPFRRFVHKGEQVTVEGTHGDAKDVAHAIWGDRNNQRTLLAG
jgi:hypothetical protein